MPTRVVVALVLSAVGCGSTPAGSAGTSAAAPGSAPVATNASSTAVRAPSAVAGGVQALALPGVSAPVFLDYLAYEPAHARVWVPMADAGAVAVLDVATRTFRRVDGFKTGEHKSHGKSHLSGPTAVAVGEGFVYVGDRATNEVCSVDAATLSIGSCLALHSPIDGVAYVASAHEVWVTHPADRSLEVLDASHPPALKSKAEVKLEGEPEGYGVDEGRELFFTNLEDTDKTVAIDLKKRIVRATWEPGCGSAGPRGLAVDAKRGFVVVACTDHLQVLDAGHDGARRGHLDTGAGVDNIDYVPGRQLVPVAAGKAPRFSLATLDDKGELTVVTRNDGAPGARNVVADERGNAYVADPQAARLLVVPAPP